MSGAASLDEEGDILLDLASCQALLPAIEGAHAGAAVRNRIALLEAQLAALRDARRGAAPATGSRRGAPRAPGTPGSDE